MYRFITKPKFICLNQINRWLLKRPIAMAAQPGTLEQGLDVAKDGWFTELSSLWPGQGMSLKINEVIFKGRSDFQVGQ